MSTYWGKQEACQPDYMYTTQPTSEQWCTGVWERCIRHQRLDLSFLVLPLLSMEGMAPKTFMI